MQNTNATSSAPWWKYGHVWMVLMGPVVVVIASFFTFYLAYIGMDTLVDEDYYRKGVELNQSQDPVPTNLAPAVQARNHAATGVVVKPKQ
jgi:hypothetical protein